MSDLISRQAALDAISTFGNREYRRKQGTLQDAYKLISALPSARPSGVWIGIDDFPYEVWECSNCGCIYEGEWKPNFCGDCGADMRGGDDETANKKML